MKRRSIFWGILLVALLVPLILASTSASVSLAEYALIAVVILIVMAGFIARNLGRQPDSRPKAAPAAAPPPPAPPRRPAWPLLLGALGVLIATLAVTAFMLLSAGVLGGSPAPPEPLTPGEPVARPLDPLAGLGLPLALVAGGGGLLITFWLVMMALRGEGRQRPD